MKTRLLGTSFQRSIALRAFCVGLVLLGSCTSYLASTTDAQWTKDDIAVVEILVDPARYERYPPPPPPDDGVVEQSGMPRLGLLSRTLAMCPSGVAPNEKVSCIPAAVENRMRSALAEATWPKDMQGRFWEVLSASQPVPDLKISGVVYLSNQESRLSKVDSFISLTKPVFSSDGSKALVYVNHVCGTTCGSSQLLLFERAGGSWTVAASKVFSQR